MLTTTQRLARYAAQPGRATPTPAQRRRIRHKQRRHGAAPARLAAGAARQDHRAGRAARLEQIARDFLGTRAAGQLKDTHPKPPLPAAAVPASPVRDVAAGLRQARSGRRKVAP